MLKSDAAAFLAGVKQVEGAAASAPTNLHVITGEVGTTSEDGKTTISLDGLVFSEEDSQEIEMDTLGGLEEGDIATVLLTGENGRGMTPLAIGAPGSIDRIKSIASNAAETADAAQAVAEAVNQHFFADDNGVHVTEATQEDWDTNHTGANALINSIGQLFRDGMNNLLTLTTQNGARSLTIWDGLGNAAENIRAIIGETIQLGKASCSHVNIDDDSMEYYANEDEQVFQFSGEKNVIGSGVTSYFAMIRDGITRTGDTVMPPQKSRIKLRTTTRQSGSENVVIGSQVELYAYTRDGEGGAISVDVLNDTNGTKRSSVYLSADTVQASGTTYVNDPYRNGYQIELGSPTRLTASGSYKAGTADTMGPAVTLTAGIWLIEGGWAFSNSSSSSKRLVVGLYRSSTGHAYTYRIHTTAASNSAHRLEVSDIVVVSAASETVTLYGGSTPASTAAASQYIVAIRLA